jgi:hypothetical protein
VKTEQQSQPLLDATNQRKKLARAGYASIGGLAATFVAQWLAPTLPLAVLLVVVGVSGALLLAGALYALYAIRCPGCNLAWVRWSVSHQSHSEWLHWLFEFTTCPGCGCETETTGFNSEQPNRAFKRTDAGGADLLVHQPLRAPAPSA